MKKDLLLLPQGVLLIMAAILAIKNEPSLSLLILGLAVILNYVRNK